MTDGESWDPINNLMLKRSKGVGSVERYHENGQLKSKGIHKNGLKCGEWFEDGETVTHPPC